MATDVEKKVDDTRPREELVYKADPFAFLFRELDLMHNEIREIKGELKTGLDATNKRIDSMNDSINKRFDKLYLIVILNLIGIVSFLIKEFFF